MAGRKGHTMTSIPQAVARHIYTDTAGNVGQWFWQYMGPRNRHRRQALLAVMLGRKTTVKESTLTNIETRLVTYVDMNGCDCHAQRMNRLNEALTRAINLSGYTQIERATL